MAAKIERVVYFDGECGLCDRIVRWLLRFDRKRQLAFAPLDGQTAARKLAPFYVRDKRTLVYQNARGIFLRSAAVVEILKDLGGAAGLMGRGLWIVPRPLRDGVYNVVAAQRARFGPKTKCPLPEESGHRILP